ncbi:MAG: SDR family NAD(P)-dependent oxidoreductase [Burkholderiaceae bacterium]|nr:SDR family NAD(P)-dependent oxidoreductase [Burkholderiaceae bacterium]
MNLAGKVAIIAGGASGLGRRTAEFFVQSRNAKVVVFDLDDRAASELRDTLGERSLACLHVDLSDERQVAQGVADAVARFGAVHVSVNCAAVPGPMRIVDRELKASNCRRFADTIAVNLIGAFNLMAHAAAQMARNEPGEDLERGVVINVASGAAFEGQSGQSAYAASKAGVVGLSLPAARELSRYGIRVNSIAPGLFDTPMARSVGADALDALTAVVQFPNRPGDPQEFARLCAHICENAYFNGACIRLDGAARLPPR